MKIGIIGMGFIGGATSEVLLLPKVKGKGQLLL